MYKEGQDHPARQTVPPSPNGLKLLLNTHWEIALLQDIMMLCCVIYAYFLNVTWEGQGHLLRHRNGWVYVLGISYPL